MGAGGKNPARRRDFKAKLFLLAVRNAVLLCGRGAVGVFDILRGDVLRVIVVHQKIVVKVVAVQSFFLVQLGCKGDQQSDQRNAQCNQGNQYTFLHGAHSFFKR